MRKPVKGALVCPTCNSPVPALQNRYGELWANGGRYVACPDSFHTQPQDGGEGARAESVTTTDEFPPSREAQILRREDVRRAFDAALDELDGAAPVPPDEHYWIVVCEHGVNAHLAESVPDPGCHPATIKVVPWVPPDEGEAVRRGDQDDLRDAFAHMNAYQRANLRVALRVLRGIGLDTGDWLGELLNVLVTLDPGTRANQDVDQQIETVQRRFASPSPEGLEEAARALRTIDNLSRVADEGHPPARTIFQALTECGRLAREAIAALPTQEGSEDG